MQLFFSAKVNFIDENSGRKFNMNFTRRVSSGRALGARAPLPLLKIKGRQKRKRWQKEGRKEERKEERKEGRKEGREREEGREAGRDAQNEKRVAEKRKR